MQSLVAGEHWKTTIITDGKPTLVPDYAKVHFYLAPRLCLNLLTYHQVQGLLIGVVAAFVIFITIIGPE